jgi:N-acetylglucosamine-6-phosphate deacetylase
MSSRRIFGRAFVRGSIQDDTLITIADGTLVEVEQTSSIPSDAETTSALIVPGLVDLHVHGADGADFMDGDEESNGRILAFHARHGTTALAATTLSASRGDLESAVEAIARSGGRRRSAEVVAIHLEGPYINAEKAGAQDRGSIRPADIQELAALISEAPRLKWIVTIAPEIEGAMALIEHFRDRVTFSIGHTNATFSEAVAAVEMGASHFTHLFNAMTPLRHREPGVVGAALLEVDTTVELIADGIHVHKAVLHIAATTMPHRVALVTDAMRACGLGDGTYKLYGKEVVVADGAARLADSGALAGSVLTMARAVKNMVELAGVPIERVLPLATSIPARVAGVGDRKGKIESGYDADLLLLDDRLEVERVYVRGEALEP